MAGIAGAPAHRALRGIDLDIPAGCVFGLLGPNGAGKSTLINILAGLVVKTAGKVTIWGFDQDVNPRQSRAAIGVMPQELNLDAFFAPRAALEVQAGLYGVPKAQRRTDEILGWWGWRTRRGLCAHPVGRHAAAAAAGQGAGASPAYPGAGRAHRRRRYRAARMLWDNVRRLNDEGMTIVLTTHYLEEAEQMCDEIAIINHGRLVARDTTARCSGGSTPRPW